MSVIVDLQALETVPYSEGSPRIIHVSPTFSTDSGVVVIRCSLGRAVRAVRHQPAP